MNWNLFPEPGINSIIDLHHASTIKIPAARKAGVSAIIHKATEGQNFRDSKYLSRRAEAKALGLLWGSYHFSTERTVALQVKNYLSFVKPGKDELICLDFEQYKGRGMTLKQAEEFVKLVHKELGRYPMIFGGEYLVKQVGTQKNEILSKCPLWYMYYADKPEKIPTQVWPDYTIWQYTDGNRGGSPGIVNGIRCDRSYFKGTEQELRKRWPFS